MGRRNRFEAGAIAIAIGRDTRARELELRAAVTAASPVWPKSPTPQAFLPLVLLLVTVLPWLHVRFHAWLTPDLAAWGLRALDVLDGDWFEPGETGRPTPPMFAWCLALAQLIPGVDKLMLLAAPSCFFGVLSCLLTYRLGRLWYNPSTGLLACFLLAVNPLLLREMQRGNPSTLTLFFTLAVLVVFAEHIRRQEEVVSIWTALGVVAFTGLLLSAGLFAVWPVVLGVVVLSYLHYDPREHRWTSLTRMLSDSATQAGAATVVLGALAAAPWLLPAVIAAPGLLHAGWNVGPYFPWTSPDIEAPAAVGWGAVAEAMSATLVLALYGLAKSIRDCLRKNQSAGREALPVFWTLLAAFALRTTHPTHGTLLVLVAPLTLLAVRTLFDVLDRRVADRRVLALAVATGWVYLFIEVPALSNLPQRFRSAGLGLEAADWLTLRLGLDGLAAIAVVLAGLYRQTSQSDDRRRAFFGGVVVAVLFLACLPGLLQLRSRPRWEDPWFQVRYEVEAALRGHDYDLIVFVDPQAKAAQAPASPTRFDARTTPLQFLMRTRFPKAPQHFVADARELEDLLRTGGKRPIVLVTDPVHRLFRSTPISRGSQTLTLVERFDSDRVILYTPVESRAEGG